MVGKGKKLLRDTLSLAELNNRKITTDFYDKKQEHSMKIVICSYS